MGGVKKVTAKPRTITPAQRGYIIQRVLVDGLKPSEAARLYAVEERLIETWVAAYRRDGMASLRTDPARTVAARFFGPRLSRLLHAFHRLAHATFAPSPQDRPTTPSPLRRSQDDRRGGS
jgi:transposase-like protein